MSSWFSASTWRAAGATAQRIWRLSVPYFNGDEKWHARGQFAAIVLLNLASVYMLVLINKWYRVFYDALQDRSAPVFWPQIWVFCGLAGIYIVIAVYKFWLTQLLELHWRTWMTQHYLGRWLAHRAYYRIEQTRHLLSGSGTPRRADNPDQRIAEDLNLFTAYTITLSMGLLNSVVTLASFVGILWGLSGNFAFHAGTHAFNIPGFMVWMAVAYAAVGSVITHYIGRPLIGLNFNQQRTEADFRHQLVRVREYAESIALDRGESVERSLLGRRYTSVFDATFRLLRRQKALTWFTAGFAQAAVVFPFIVTAPRYFSGAIQLGELMQINSAFGRVQDALGWFIDSYANLAAWRATADRLTSFDAAVRRAEQHSGPDVEVAPNADGFAARALEIARPAGRTQTLQPLVSAPQLRVAAGDRVLVSGPSGAGKSTLFRALAGIWPYGSGTVSAPAGDTMFLPQRPYFPDGRLRDALAYPELAERYDDAALKAALGSAGLAALAGELDVADAWNQRLSGGEQQRLALARVFLKRPRWLFTDEATSALDAAAENRLYERLLALVTARDGALVSITHRPELARWHRERWQIVPQADGAARVATAPLPA